MDAIQEIYEVVTKALEDNTGYRLSKETGVSITAIQRFKNGTSDIDNMTLSTAKKIYEFAKKVEQQG